MNPGTFDDRHIQWNTLAGFDHLHYSILDIDEPNKIVDVLFRFAALPANRAASPCGAQQYVRGSRRAPAL